MDTTNHSTTDVKLESERLILRDLGAGDDVALLEIEGDAQVVRYMQHEPQNLKQMREYLAKSIEEQSADPRTVFDLGVILRNTNAVIGRCGFRITKPEHHEAMLWYLIHPDHWGNGYAVEAARAVCAFAFDDLNIHRVWADCDPRNTASARVAEKLGMTLEGHLRENFLLKNEWCDSLIYAVLADEFQRKARPAKGS